MRGYGSSKISKESKMIHKEQIKKLDALAKKKSAIIYSQFVESLKEEDCIGLSGAELLALATLTGSLFSASIVFAIYYDLIEKKSNLQKLYTEKQMEDEIIKTHIHYVRQIIASMKKGNVQ